jgi:hypothetical protein
MFSCRLKSAKIQKRMIRAGNRNRFRYTHVDRFTYKIARFLSNDSDLLIANQVSTHLLRAY